MAKNEVLERLRELEAKRESFGIEFMIASTPEETEVIRGEMSKVDYEIDELKKSNNIITN